MSYRLGAVVVQLLADNVSFSNDALTALYLRNHRVGFDRPVTPTTLAAHVEEAQAWLAQEVEEGRDPMFEDIQEAVAAIGRRPSAALVPQSPSPS